MGSERSLSRLGFLLFGITVVLGQGLQQQDCRCVNIYKCAVLLDALRTFGSGASDFVRDAHCGFEGNDPKVCCPGQEPGVDLNPRPETSSTPPYRPPTPSYRPPTPPYRPPTSTRPPPFPGLQRPGLNRAERSNCGYSDAPHNRIVGGVAAKRGAWPWIAALGYRNTKATEPKWLCGGSLISRRHILTAAHCVHNRVDLYLVRLGEHELLNTTDGANPIDVKIAHKDIHPSYSTKTFENDVAVLTLEREVDFDEWIHPVCLPISNEIRNLDLVGYLPFVAGWGTVSYRGPSSSVLREVQVKVQPTDKCLQAYRRLKPDVAIDERVLCAGYEVGGKDACQGDSGGPLMLPKPGFYWYQIGIVSFGHRCAEPNFPGIYTKVEAFLDFIYAAVTQRGGQLCLTCGKS